MLVCSGKVLQCAVRRKSVLPSQHKGEEGGITIVSIQVGKRGEESENFNDTSKISARVGNRIVA